MKADGQKWLILAVTLALIGGAGGLLAHQHAHQKLALPGVKTHPLPGSSNLEVELPERVLDCNSQWLPVDEITSNTLPRDTSFGARYYTAPGGFQTVLSVVLMGADRTSLHKPQFCLEGQGWHIDQTASQADHISINRPVAYDLPVVKLVASRVREIEGQKVTTRGVYVYWYVADDALSATVSGFERMWLMSKRLLRTGVLQRWAYASCLCECLPGQEDATYDRMKKFIAASVPEFQLNPRPEPTMRAATQP